MSNAQKFFKDETYLFLIFANGVIHICVPEVEMMSILGHVTHPLLGVIIMVFGQPVKFYNVDIIVQLLINIVMIM